MLKLIALGIVLLSGLQVGTAWADDALDNSLFDAVKSYDTTKVETLIAQGADVNAKDKDGNSPLYFATLQNSTAIVEALLSQGANPKSNDYSSIRIAARQGSKGVMEAFLAHGINPNLKLGIFETPLLYLAVEWIEGGNKAAAEVLIVHGADVNAKDKDGNTPLTWASYTGKKEIAKLLISKGADVNVKNNDGYTPLQMTYHINDPKVKQEIIALLQGQMANQSNPRQLWNSLLEQFKGHSDNDELRKSIIKTALKLKPAPAIPQEAEDAAGRAAYIFKIAKSDDDFLNTAKEYLNAVELAPWVANYYYNLCTVLEKTPYTPQALHACKLYLDAAPNAADAADMRQHIAGLKFALDKNKEQIKQRTAYLKRSGIDNLYRFGGMSGNMAGKDVAIKLTVDWQASPPKYQVFAACIEGDGVQGNASDLVSTDTWITLCKTSFHLVLKPDGAGFVELGGSGNLRTTLDELFQRKQKALAQSPIFMDSVYDSGKGVRFFVAYVQGGRNNQYAGYAMYESDCNGNLLHQDPRALPDDFSSTESNRINTQFHALKDYMGEAQSGCNDKFVEKTGYHFGEKE